MSDDTPTQRFPSPDSGNVPTQRLDIVSEELVEEKKKSNALLVILIVLGLLLIGGIIVVAVLLLGKNSGSPVVADSGTPTTQPSVSESPSAPSPTPSQTQDAPPPPSTDVTIDSFSVSPTTVFCNTANDPGVNHNQYLHFAWKTSNADTVDIGTYDQYGDYSVMYANFPSDGNTDALGLQITYFCPQASQVWRLEATGNGHTVKQEIKIVNTGDTQ